MTAPADLKEIIGRLEPLLGPSDGEPAPLDGGITNRNYRARPGGEDHVIRLPGNDKALLDQRFTVYELERGQPSGGDQASGKDRLAPSGRSAQHASLVRKHRISRLPLSRVQVASEFSHERLAIDTLVM